MTTLAKTKVEVAVNVIEKSVTYMVNTLFQLFFRIAKERGLGADYLVGNKDCLERGFFTWLSEQSLVSVHFEVISPEGSRALERWDVSFAYAAEADPNVRKPPVEEVVKLSRKMRSLPPGTSYRILVQVKDFASQVEGWSDSEFLEFSPAREESFRDWGYGTVGGRLLYREGTW